MFCKPKLVSCYKLNPNLRKLNRNTSSCPEWVCSRSSGRWDKGGWFLFLPKKKYLRYLYQLNFVRKKDKVKLIFISKSSKKHKTNQIFMLIHQKCMKEIKNVIREKWENCAREIIFSTHEAATFGGNFFVVVVENVMKKIKCKLSHGRDNIFQNLHWKHAFKCDRSNIVDLHPEKSIHFLSMLACYATNYKYMTYVILKWNLIDLISWLAFVEHSKGPNDQALILHRQFDLTNWMDFPAWKRLSLKQNNFRVLLCIYNDS